MIHEEITGVINALRKFERWNTGGYGGRRKYSQDSFLPVHNGTSIEKSESKSQLSTLNEGGSKSESEAVKKKGTLEVVLELTRYQDRAFQNGGNMSHSNQFSVRKIDSVTH